jgi:Tol biopolymer transport system component
LFAIGREPSRGEFVRFEPFSRTFGPFLPGISGDYPDLSRDGKWVAYIDMEGGSLWTGRTDGSNRRQLTSSFEAVELPRWSPDGNEIAFMAKKTGRPWRIYMVSSGGGAPREASLGDGNQGAPTWSADGKWLAYGDILCQTRNDCAVHRIELATRKTETISGSGGLRTARWSPNGRYIAALQAERHQLLVFDIAKQSWKKLSDAITGDDLSWSPDSAYIYSNRPVGEQPGIFRIPVKGGNPETVVDLEEFSRLTGKYDFGLCVAPDGSVILLRQVNSSEIYALDWSLR